MKNTIPAEVWTQHVGILAKTGRGKTIAAKGGAAALMKAGIRCGVVDPTAAWWGMRIKADGKTPAFPMVIFGGDHGDIAIDARFDKTVRYDPVLMGAKVGALVASAPWSWILDISKLNSDTRAPFMTGFAEALFSENKRRLNLFLDECHLYMPQQKLPTRASAHMTAACNNLVSGGRSRGFNITMISQRSAKVHKDSLTQAETLITLGMIAPHDIAAVEGWVKVQGDLKAAKAMLESLPALPVGTGWIYAPELGMLDKVKFPMIDTFDSSRAPGVGDDLRAPTELAKIDLDEIRALLAPPGPKPRPAPEPRAALAGALDAALGEVGRASPSKPVEKINMADRRAQGRALAAARAEGADAVRLGIPALLDAQHAESFEMGYRHAAITATEMLQGMREAFPEPRPGRKRLKDFHRLMQAQVPNIATSAPAGPAKAVPAAPAREPRQSADGHAPGLGKAELAILKVLAHFPDAGASKAKVAVWAGYSASSGSFRNSLSSLRTSGLLFPGEPMRLTDKGLAAAGPLEPLPSGEALLAFWKNHRALGKAEQTILGVIVSNGVWEGVSLSKEEVARLSGYEVTSGSFRNALSRLRTLDLIKGSGELRGAEEFA